MGRKSKKKINKIYSLILLIIIGIIVANSPAIDIVDDTVSNIGNSIISKSASAENEIVANISNNIVIDESLLNILFLDVGQADCELIISGGKTILIDAGNSKDGEVIVNCLNALGITKIDYVIGTHIHEDHIGGMSYIINSFDIGEIYLPYNETSTLSYYKKLLTAIADKNLSITEIGIGDIFEIETVECEIMSVRNDEPDNANLASIVIEMRYGDLKYLFMGDAETGNEKSRNWNDIDVLKVGHHGSNTSTSEYFLNQTLPEIAIVSVGQNNSYNLPKDNILNRLSEIGATIYRTDNDGTIQITSDGTQNWVTKIDISFDGNSLN